MNRPAYHPARRHGFTIIELLCVIAIILILVSITIPAVFKALETVDDVKCRADIGELGRALEAFKSRFGRYPPSRFNVNDPATINWVRSCWPRIASMQGFPPSMEGHECLVFFLGGRQMTIGGVPACLGFSPNQAAPLMPPQPNELKIGPFFEFKSDRLQIGPRGVYVYLDTFRPPSGVRQPYLYFVSGAGFNSYGSSDCISAGVLAYKETIQFVNPETFQIISAGKDGLFGPGGTWMRRNPRINPAYAETGPGYNDLANFHDRRLGIPSY